LTDIFVTEALCRGSLRIFSLLQMPLDKLLMNLDCFRSRFSGLPASAAKAAFTRFSKPASTFSGEGEAVEPDVQSIHMHAVSEVA
jgi:hypothetical protein